MLRLRGSIALEDYADWDFANLKVLPNLTVLHGGRSQCLSAPVPIEEFLASIPPPNRTHGEGEDRPPTTRTPAAGAELIAREPWMYPHIHGAGAALGGGHGGPGGGDPPLEDPGELDEVDEVHAMALDVYGALAEARALCHFPHLGADYRVKPLGGEDTAERLHMAYDAYRGYWNRQLHTNSKILLRS